MNAADCFQRILSSLQRKSYLICPWKAQYRHSGVKAPNLSISPPPSTPSNMSDKFMVVFKRGTPQSEIDKYANQVQENGGEIHHRFDSGLNGFAATINNAHLQELQSLQGGVIDYIERDSKVTTQ